MCVFLHYPGITLAACTFWYGCTACVLVCHCPSAPTRCVWSASLCSFFTPTTRKCIVSN